MTTKLKPLPWWVIGSAIGPVVINVLQQDWHEVIPWSLVALYMFLLRQQEQSYNQLIDHSHRVALKAIELTIDEIQARHRE